MKKQIKETGKHVISGGVGLAIGLALTWNGAPFLEDIGNAVDQLTRLVTNLEQDNEDLDGAVTHYEEQLDLANEQIRRANYDTRQLHRRVSEAIEGIDGVYLQLNSEDLVVE